MTGPDGAFRFDDVKSGTYDVSTRRLGFLPQLRRAKVGDDGGTMTFSLSSRGASAREEFAMDSLVYRLNTRHPARSAIYSREDINRMGVADAGQLATIGAGMPVADDCSALIDGGPTRAPIWAFGAADIETMEIYYSATPDLRTGEYLGSRSAAASPDGIE